MENETLRAIIPAGAGKELIEVLETEFSGFISQAEEWEKKAREIKITREDDEEGMALAREARLGIRAVRIAGTKAGKDIKSGYLIGSQTCDAVVRFFKERIEPIEEYLKEQEEYAVRQKMARYHQLADKRKKEILECGGPEPVSMDLGGMEEETYQLILAGIKSQVEKRRADLEAEQRAEEEALEAQYQKEQEEEQRRQKEVEDRLAKQRLQADRLEAMLPYNKYGEEMDMSTLWTLEEDKFREILSARMAAKKKKEEEEAVLSEIGQKRLQEISYCFNDGPVLSMQELRVMPEKEYQKVKDEKIRACNERIEKEQTAESRINALAEERIKWLQSKGYERKENGPDRWTLDTDSGVIGVDAAALREYDSSSWDKVVGTTEEAIKLMRPESLDQKLLLDYLTRVKAVSVSAKLNSDKGREILRDFSTELELILEDSYKETQKLVK